MVCLFEEKESAYRAQLSSFIIVLGYDGDAAKPWCVVKQYNHQSLRDIWDSTRGGKLNGVTEDSFFLKGGVVVSVNLDLAIENAAKIEVRVRCEYDLGDKFDDESLSDRDPLSIFSSTNSVAAICIKLVTYLEKRRAADSTRQIDLPVIESVTSGFIDDLEALGTANKAIQTLFHQEISKSHSFIPNTFWHQIAGNLKNCRKVLELLRNLLEDIYQKLPKYDHDAGPFLEYVYEKFNPSHNKYLKEALDNISIYHKILKMSLLMAIL